MSRTHREALASLVNGIECGFGFQVLVAQPGMGKTTLLFDLLERFHSSRTAFLFQQQHDSREFLQSLLIELKSDAGETSHARLYSQLNQLLSEAAVTRERVIVVVDEAQNLDDSVLETLRQLSNFETARSKLLQIVLAGQPQLAKRLAQPQQEQLRQRVSTLARLSPLGLDETRIYLNHRLNIAGYRGPEFFSNPALQLIWSVSHGIPRNVNTLCFNSMLTAFAQGSKRVDELAIKEAAQDLDLEFVLADMAGAHPGSDSFESENGGTTLRIELRAEKPTTAEKPAPPPPAGNGRRPLVEPPKQEPLAVSQSIAGVERTLLSEKPKSTVRPAPVLQSAAPDIKRQAIVAKETPLPSPSPSGRIAKRNDGAEEKNNRDRNELPMTASSNRPQPPPVAPIQGSHISRGKKLVWASLLAAAACAGVLFGHGLGSRGQQSGEGPESVSMVQQVQDTQPALDAAPTPAPLTAPRKSKDTKSNSYADDGPEIVVRTFPPSNPITPGAAQPNAKTIYFDEDSAELTSKYNTAIQSVAEMLTTNPQSSAIIEGHTDNSGEETYNLSLSIRRAAAVKDVLVNQYQIPSARLSTIGAGSTAPLESNSTSSGRAYNRRVEMRIVQSERTLAAGSDPR